MPLHLQHWVQTPILSQRERGRHSGWMPVGRDRWGHLGRWLPQGSRDRRQTSTILVIPFHFWTLNCISYSKHWNLKVRGGRTPSRTISSLDHSMGFHLIQPCFSNWGTGTLRGTLLYLWDMQSYTAGTRPSSWSISRLYSISNLKQGTKQNAGFTNIQDKTWHFKGIFTLGEPVWGYTLLSLNAFSFLHRGSFKTTALG